MLAYVNPIIMKRARDDTALIDSVVSDILTEKRNQSCTKCKRLAHVTAEGDRRAWCLRCLESSRQSQHRARTREVGEGERVCAVCRRVKTEAEFGNHAQVHKRRQANLSCTACAEVAKAFRRNNPRRRACAEWWEEWRMQPCAHCGLEDPSVMEADHIVPHAKGRVLLSNIAHWCKVGRGVAAMEDEARLCQPLCVVCHRLKSKGERDAAKKSSGQLSMTPHAITQRRAVQRNYAHINARKLEQGECSICAKRVTEATLCCFDYMHRSRAQKSSDLSQMAASGASLARIDEEIAKCSLGCANCHRRATLVENAELAAAASE